VELHAKIRSSSSGDGGTDSSNKPTTNNDGEDENDNGVEGGDNHHRQSQQIEDIFYVVQRDTGRQFPDDELEELAEGLLDATRTPMNVGTVKAAMHELELTNSNLKARIEKLEKALYKQQITVIPSPSSTPATPNEWSE